MAVRGGDVEAGAEVVVHRVHVRAALHQLAHRRHVALRRHLTELVRHGEHSRGRRHAHVERALRLLHLRLRNGSGRHEARPRAPRGAARNAKRHPPRTPTRRRCQPPCESHRYLKVALCRFGARDRTRELNCESSTRVDFARVNRRGGKTFYTRFLYPVRYEGRRRRRHRARRLASLRTSAARYRAIPSHLTHSLFPTRHSGSCAVFRARNASMKCAVPALWTRRKKIGGLRCLADHQRTSRGGNYARSDGEARCGRGGGAPVCRGTAQRR